MSLVLLGQGRIDEALNAAMDEPAGPWRGWALAIIEYQAGRPQEAERLLDEFIRDFGSTGAFQIAEVYASMGRTDEAFEALDLALTTRDPGVGAIVVSPLLKSLHSDARWQLLLRKIGIPEEYWPSNI